MGEKKWNLQRWAFVPVVGLVAAILFVVSVAGVRIWRAKSQTLACMSKAKAINTAIRLYQVAWDGYTAPGGYVKMVGHALKGDQGYDPRTVDRVQDFRCPADRNPRKDYAGYFSSYRVIVSFAGLDEVWTHPSRFLSVYEKGKRHPHKGQPEAVYVYRDGHAELGCAKLFPGLNLAIWRPIPGIWDWVKTDPLGRPPDYEDGGWGSSLSLTKEGSESFHRFTTPEADGGEDRCLGDEIVLRLDGAISFPETGEWQLVLEYSRQVYLWFDANQDGRPDAFEVAERTAGVQGEEFSFRCGMCGTGPYRFRLVFTRHQGDLPTSVWWVTPHGKKEAIPVSALSHTLN